MSDATFVDTKNITLEKKQCRWQLSNLSARSTSKGEKTFQLGKALHTISTSSSFK